MKKTGIVTDSHSSITQDEAERLGIWVLPMPFYFGEECYYEDVDLSREEFFSRLKNGEKVTTTQPSPAEVMEIWDRALAECEEILYLPMSSGLSGSCSTAKLLAEDEPYKGRVFVVDNGRISTLLHRSILDAIDMIDKGMDTAAIRDTLEKSRNNMVIYIGIDDLKYLKMGGRISASSAFIGGMLSIKPILKFDTGLLERYKEARGTAKMKKEIIAAMKHDMETRFKDWKDRGELYLLAATSASDEETEAWVRDIQEAFPGMEVLCDRLSLGVSCHIGPGGLGIGCSCRPDY